jgi:hypothetical protein
MSVDSRQIPECMKHLRDRVVTGNMQCNKIIGIFSQGAECPGREVLEGMEHDGIVWQVGSGNSAERVREFVY